MEAQQIVYPQISEIQEFFFEAALHGYASGEKAQVFEPLPGSKAYRYERGDFVCVDCYRVNGEFSSGWMIISWKGIPVWEMHYQGWCKNSNKKYTAYLKEVLRRTYEERLSCGGRGSAVESGRGRLRREDLLYHNSYNGAFRECRGKETITERSRGCYWEVVFWHNYQCLLLIPDDASNR